jgi:hypothetical protein
MLLDKYARQKRESVFRRIGGIKRQRSHEAGAFHSGEIRREMAETRSKLQTIMAMGYGHKWPSQGRNE